MIAVVTGASGFIGQHLVSALRAANAEVRVLRRPQSRAPANAATANAERSWVVDVLDATEVARTSIWDGATHVFHLAGVSRAAREQQFIRANVTPCANIAAALSRRATPPRLLVVSSQAAAGPTPAGAVARTDAMPAVPIEAYGRSKLAGEAAAWAWRAALSITVVRPCAVYGPGDRDFLTVFRQVRRRTAWFACAPDQALSMVYVADLVSCLQHVATHERASSQRWLVAHESPVTWRSLYDEIARRSGTSPQYRTVPRALLGVGARVGDGLGRLTGRTPLLNSQKLALADASSWVCDADGVTRTTGWRATTSLAVGLEATHRWYVAAGWLREQSYTRSAR